MPWSQQRAVVVMCYALADAMREDTSPADAIREIAVRVIARPVESFAATKRGGPASRFACPRTDGFHLNILVGGKTAWICRRW